MDEILSSHVIEPELLRNDDFNAFFNKREEALLNRIEKAMGKPIAREAVEDGIEPEVTDFQENEDETES